MLRIVCTSQVSSSTTGRNARQDRRVCGAMAQTVPSATRPRGGGNEGESSLVMCISILTGIWFVAIYMINCLCE